MKHAKQRIQRMRAWEAALAAGLVLAVLFTSLIDATAKDLSSDVLRLHIVANSDSEADQSVKLIVRDKVLRVVSALLSDTKGRPEAERVLRAHLDAIACEASSALREIGVRVPIKAELAETNFPTKQYDSFALPAGRYQALRLTLGEGDGKNWWCVVFPPLCLAASEDAVVETAKGGGLSEDEIGLITGKDDTYVFQFKCLEWWDALTSVLG